MVVIYKSAFLYDKSPYATQDTYMYLVLHMVIYHIKMQIQIWGPNTNFWDLHFAMINIYCIIINNFLNNY